MAEKTPLPKNPGVYAVYSLHQSIVYIGSTQNLRTRWNSHRSALKAGNNANPGLQQHYNEVGLSNLVFFPLVFFDRTTPNLRTVLKDEENNQIMNHLSLGFTVLNRSSAKSGGYCPEDYRAEVSERAKVRGCPQFFQPEAAAKREAALTRYHQSDRGKAQNQATRQAAYQVTRKPVLLSSGAIRNNFPSLTAASRWLGVAPPTLCVAIQKGRSIRGYEASYA